MSKTNRAEIVARVPGTQIAPAFHLGRCEAERWVRSTGGGAGYDGNWARVPGCDLAFFFRLPAGGHNADVTCPGCGLRLDVTTRRLRAGFLPLTDADVAAIKAHKNRPVNVSCLAPIASAPAPVTPVAPIETPARISKRVAAEAALEAFDAKPRCAVCYGYNASHKKSDRCGFSREWNQKVGDETAEGERRQYRWNRKELADRVTKYGGQPAPAPLS